MIQNRITDMLRKPANPSAKLEAELADRRKRHAALCDKLKAAEAIYEKEAAEQRRLLVEVDDAAPAQIAAAEQACRIAADRVDALLDARQTVAGQIEDAEQALAADREKVERETAATETERRAGAIDQAAGKLAASLKAVGAEFLRLQTAINEGGVAASSHVEHINHSADTLAVSILLCGIEGVLPGVASKFRGVGIVSGETADAAASRLQSERLRRHAEDLRTGRVGVALLPTPSDIAYRPPVVERAGRTRIVLSEPIIYQDEMHAPVRVVAGGVDLPIPVANRAAKLGIGHAPDSSQGRTIVARIEAQPHYSNTGSWRDIGVNLAEQAGR